MDGSGSHIDACIAGTNKKIECNIFDYFQRLIAVRKEWIESGQSSLDPFTQMRADYNAKGQMRERTDRGVRTTYEYDLMGELCTQIQPLSTSPTPYNSPYKEYAYTYEVKPDGVYRKTTVTDYNAAGYPLTTMREELVSELSPTLESKTIETDIYGKVTTEWTEYNGAVKRKVQRTIPTSSITAETLMEDGFIVSQKDHAGVTTTWSRAYTATGSTIIQTDGRGNAVTEKRDILDCALQVTNAAGNMTSIAYDLPTGQVSVLTDALGKTTCYKYDIYGRKIAEYGTGIQPACFGYDEAGNLIRLTTFRSDGETISTDPSLRTDGDVTEWEYAWQEKLVLKKTYADGSTVTTQYGDMNRVASVTDARGLVVTYTYDSATGLLKSQLFSDDGTPDIFYTYNHLGRMVEVEDGSGVREITYDGYGKPDAETVTIQGTEYRLTELYDAYGRSSGHELIQGTGTSLLHIAQGYGTDGKLATAGLRTATGMQSFGYSYLPGTYLPGTLTMPGGIRRELAYEEHRDLTTQILYRKGDANIAVRTQTYDVLGRPAARNQQRGTEAVRNDVFTYNDRNELTGATLGLQNYAYDYDKTADGRKAVWTNAEHLPEGREAEGRLRVNIGNRNQHNEVIPGEIYHYAYDNIGNRKTAKETLDITYETNNLNQYTAIMERENEPFRPVFDTNGNQTLTHTETGIWEVEYNAANRPVKFTRGDNTEMECGYDYMGRRWFKKVTENGTVTKHERYLYRGYLQIAALDMLQQEGETPVVKHVVLWDPQDPVVTRPLALLAGGNLYMYGFDFNKNVTELLNDQGQLAASYDYTPYGSVSSSGEAAEINPLQWSSEVRDEELRMVYYNYRYLNSLDGRWISRDFIGEQGGKNPYCMCNNSTYNRYDYLGLSSVNPISLAEAAAAGLTAEQLSEIFGITMAAASAIAAKAALCESLRKIKEAAVNEAEKKGRCGGRYDCKRCSEYAEKAVVWWNVYVARVNYDTQCFNGGNEGHIKQQDNVKKAQERCYRFVLKCLKGDKK